MRVANHLRTILASLEIVWDNYRKIEKIDFFKLISLAFAWFRVDFGRHLSKKMIFSMRNQFKQNLLDRKLNYDPNKLPLSYFGHTYPFGKSL